MFNAQKYIEKENEIQSCIINLTPPQSVVVQHRRELKQVLSHYGVNSLFKQLQAPNEITINYPENVGRANISEIIYYSSTGGRNGNWFFA